jgi:hypothetical protein
MKLWRRSTARPPITPGSQSPPTHPSRSEFLRARRVGSRRRGGTVLLVIHGAEQLIRLVRLGALGHPPDQSPRCSAVWVASLVPPLAQTGGSQRAREALETISAALLACCPAGKQLRRPRPAGGLSDTRTTYHWPLGSAVGCLPLPSLGSSRSHGPFPIDSECEVTCRRCITHGAIDISC